MAPTTDTATSDAIAPVRQRLQEMLATEEAIGAHLRAGLDAVAGHQASATALGRFLDTAGRQLGAVTDLLGEGGAGSSAAAADRPDVAVGPAAGTGTGAEAALRGASALFGEAVLGYAALHQTAHVFHTGQLGPVLKLAAQHMRGYAAAAREIDQLIADVVAWELRRDGQRCVCPCAYCSLGVCWCIADTTDTLNAAWHDAAPAAEGVRVARNTRATPSLDVREGDVVVAVNDAPVTSVSDVRAAAPSPPPGTPVRLTVRRPDGATEVVVAARS